MGFFGGGGSLLANGFRPPDGRQQLIALTEFPGQLLFFSFLGSRVLFTVMWMPDDGKHSVVYEKWLAEVNNGGPAGGSRGSQGDWVGCGEL